MIGLLQRVSEASVRVGDTEIAAISRGLLVFVAVVPDDTPRAVDRMAERLLTYRVFADQTGRMNRSVLDVDAGLLLVPQFTLAADTRKGTRASFTKAATPEQARTHFGALLDACRRKIPNTGSGEFGADMQVKLINDGPVTFWLQT